MKKKQGSKMGQMGTIRTVGDNIPHTFKKNHTLVHKRMERIDIKLLKKKWQPILDMIMEHTASKNYTEVVELIIFHCYSEMTQKFKELDNMTICEYICKKRGITMESRILEFMREFCRFLKGEGE